MVSPSLIKQMLVYQNKSVNGDITYLLWQIHSPVHLQIRYPWQCLFSIRLSNSDTIKHNQNSTYTHVKCCTGMYISLQNIPEPMSHVSGMPTMPTRLTPCEPRWKFCYFITGSSWTPIAVGIVVVLKSWRCPHMDKADGTARQRLTTLRTWWHLQNIILTHLETLYISNLKGMSYCRMHHVPQLYIFVYL